MIAGLFLLFLIAAGLARFHSRRWALGVFFAALVLSFIVLKLHATSELTIVL